MTVHMAGPRNPAPDPDNCINTTSRSTTWSRGLSPFFLGPLDLYEHEGEMIVAKNMENAWQYAKVYKAHGDDDGPGPGYWEWAKQGWDKKRADRYPMGKGSVPMYSWWAGEKLGYIDARKRIYAPLYADAIGKTDSFRILKGMYERRGEIWLWDFDSYDYIKDGMSFDDVLNCPERKMGHGFVLAMMLSGERAWED
jgi:hypothetical protein